MNTCQPCERRDVVRARAMPLAPPGKGLVSIVCEAGGGCGMELEYGINTRNVCGFGSAHPLWF
jgi:hypothetical protein